MNFKERIRIAKESEGFPSVVEVRAQQKATDEARQVRERRQAEAERQRAEEVWQTLRLVSDRFFALDPLPPADMRALLGTKEQHDFSLMKQNRPTGFLSTAHASFPPKQWQLDRYEKKLTRYLERHSKQLWDMRAGVVYLPDSEGEGGGVDRLYLTEERSIAALGRGFLRNDITDGWPIIYEPGGHDSILKGQEDEILNGLARFVVDRGLELE